MRLLMIVAVSAFSLFAWPVTADHESTTQTFDLPNGSRYYLTTYDPGIHGASMVGLREETNGCPGMQAHEADCDDDEVVEPADELIL